MVADAFRLPFGPASFDFVFSSLFLHHFTNDQVVELFRSFHGLARRAVLAIDLDRGPLAYRFAPIRAGCSAGTTLPSAMARFQVAAAFQKDELPRARGARWIEQPSAFERCIGRGRDCRWSHWCRRDLPQ